MIPKPLTCKPCPLYGNGYGFSSLDGSGKNGVLIIGDALGDSEQSEGLPFRPYAQAGSILQRTINGLGLQRNDFAITNIVRCRPPYNILDGARYELDAPVS